MQVWTGVRCVAITQCRFTVVLQKTRYTHEESVSPIAIVLLGLGSSMHTYINRENNALPNIHTLTQGVRGDMVMNSAKAN